MSARRLPNGGITVAGAMFLLGLVALLARGTPIPVGAALLALATLTAGATLARHRSHRRRSGTARVPRPETRATLTRAGTAVSGALMLTGLLVGLIEPGLATTALELMAAGAVSALSLGAPAVGRAIRRAAPVLLGVALLVAVIVVVARLGVGSQIGPGGLWLPISVFAFGAGGVFLLAIALGVGQAHLPPAGTGDAPRPGRAMRRSSTVWRAIAGTLMVLWAIGVGMALVEAHVARDPALVIVSALAVVATAVLIIATPLSMTTYFARRRLLAERTREAERQRIAAHLRDSVLQTLALVQRQAGDAGAVTRLARRQEVSLRAWLNGEGELTPGSLRAALQAVIREIEDAYEVSVELSMVGDRSSEPNDQALLGALGEALRNVVRHARGSPATVFAEVGDRMVEVFVSDAGPGFDLDAIPEDRRGIRESIVARMAAGGGIAEITTGPGQGTDVLLRLPAA